MGPLPQELCSLVDAQFLERREHLHLAPAGLQSPNRQGLGLFGAGQLVGLGEQHQKLQSFLDAGAHDFEQGFVQFGQAQARIAQQHDTGQAGAADQVIHHHLLPAFLVGARNGSVTVAGQVGQHSVGDALAAE